MTSKEIASTASRTMPMGPCGTSVKRRCGVSRLIDASSQCSTSTCSFPERTTNPSVCQRSTMSSMLATSRSQRAGLPVSWAMTSLGRGTGHQLSPQALKSACHGSAIALLMVPGATEEASRNAAAYGASRMGRSPAERPPASIPGKNAPPTHASSAARSSPSGVIAVSGAGTPVQSLV